MSTKLPLTVSEFTGDTDGSKSTNQSKASDIDVGHDYPRCGAELAVPYCTIGWTVSEMGNYRPAFERHQTLFHHHAALLLYWLA